MAGQLSVVERENLKRYREIRDEIHSFVLSLVNHIATELKTNGFRKNGSADLTMKLVEMKLVELEKWDGKIQNIAPADEVAYDVRASHELYSTNLNKIIEAVSGMDDEMLLQASFEWLFPLFQMPAGFAGED